MMPFIFFKLADLVHWNTIMLEGSFCCFSESGITSLDGLKCYSSLVNTSKIKCPRKLVHFKSYLILYLWIG